MAYDLFKAALCPLAAIFSKIVKGPMKAEQAAITSPPLPVASNPVSKPQPEAIRTIPKSAIGHTHDGVSSTGITVAKWCRQRGVPFREDDRENLVVNLDPHQARAFDFAFDKASYSRPAAPTRPTGKPDPALWRDGPGR